MCGILGAIGQFPKPVFEKGLHRLAHRGPDGWGIWEDSRHPLRLGHRRLAIIDLSDAAKQPMSDHKFVITYNGEIYNYIELRNELTSKGHLFRTTSDTEVILKAYQEWGPACLNKFNGMWSFCIWDAQTKTLFLARDRFGVKPLFYSFTSKGFVFGSEMKSITPFLDRIEPSGNFEWFKENIYNYETTDKCLIDNLFRFPAGHYARVSIDDKKLTPIRYWNTLDHLEDVDSNYKNQVLEFKEIFLDACRIRMRSDVRLGTALSGGLDSSTVAAAMNYLGSQNSTNQKRTDWQNAFVATFPGTKLDETEYAQKVVSTLNLKGNFLPIDASKGIGMLSEYFWFFEELFPTSPVPMIEIYKSIKANGVTVSLDGHGADELFSGYGSMLLKAIKDVPFNYASIKNIIETYKAAYQINKPNIKVLVDGFAGRKKLIQYYISYILRNQESDPLIKRLGHFNACLYNEFHSYILPTLLRNYDRYSMAAGVEVRMPFLDYRLVSYCFSLPWQSKLRNGFTKSILRDAMKGLLTDEILNRKPKTGFGTPFTEWFVGPWKEFTRDTIASTAFRNTRFLNPQQAIRIVNQFYENPHPNMEDGNAVWEQLMPYFWETGFYDNLK